MIDTTDPRLLGAVLTHFGPNDPITPPPEPGQDEGTPGCGGEYNTSGCGKCVHVIGTNGGMLYCGASLRRSNGAMETYFCDTCSSNARPVAAPSGATEDKIDTSVEPSVPSFGLGDRPAVAPLATSASPAAQTAAFTRAPDRDHNGSHAWQHADHGFLAIPGAIPVSCPVCEESGFRRRLRALLNDWKDSGERDPKIDPLLVALDRALNPPHRTQDEINGESLAYEYAKAPGAFLAKFDEFSPARQAAVTQAFAAFLGCDVSVVDELWVESRMRLA